jgi:predicted tellurium resistance membrane protein TerC
MVYTSSSTFEAVVVKAAWQASCSMDHVIALVALSCMEIVLGIDNIVFITILTSRLPVAEQAKARRIGLGVAVVSRVLLLLSISWVFGLTKPLAHMGWLDGWLEQLSVSEHTREHVVNVTMRDLILLAGGLFLIAKATLEIHRKIEGHSDQNKGAVRASFGAIIGQIAVLDIVFSIDSVITAVGMAKAIWVMIAAVMIAVGVMLVFANAVSAFVERHPTIKMLALSFLILIGVMLIAEGIGTEIGKGYIYFAMAFALGVEFLNLRVRGHGPAVSAK